MEMYRIICQQVKMKATASIMSFNHIFMLCLFCQISGVLSDCPKGQLKHGDKCCKPVLHCPSGHYVKTCELDGSCDECLPCSPGTQNPFIPSSSDVKQCYKNDCPTGFFRTSEVKCECAFHAGYIETEDKKSCQRIKGGCQPGLELNFRGRCKTCADDHYKYWNGHGSCIKHFDCFKIKHSIIPGNHIIPATCLDFNDTCSPKERDPPLPPGLKSRASPIPFTETTTRPSILVTSIMTRTHSIERTEVSHPEQTSQETTTNNPNERVLHWSKTQYIFVTVISVLVIIIAILLVYSLWKLLSNDTQRPLPKRPSSNNLTDTYMEMDMISQESNASGEEYDSSGVGSLLSMRDCSMGSETTLKVLDTAEPNPNRVGTTTTTEATSPEPVRVEPFRGDFDPTYQDAISSDYSPSFLYIQSVQMAQTGIVLPQFVHYAQP